MVPLVAGRIAETEGRIAELSAFSVHLAAVHADLSAPAPEGACGPDCGCTTTPATAGPVPVTLSPTRPAAPVPAPEPWREAPVACTLDGSELVGRTQEWRRLVEQATARAELPDGLRLTFPATAELAGQIAALAAAEQRCCSFFDFTLHLTPAALELTVRAPEAGAPLLADLFGVTA
ncbi:hypothetical protein ACIPYQ_10775 [Streptomyces sp. NPDC090045]|uniref:hypothetical protein n=1 Tax=Streptomyces sp. NPDC090045 TaxID=3365927 RepID=UPI0037FB6F49